MNDLIPYLVVDRVLKITSYIARVRDCILCTDHCHMFHKYVQISGVDFISGVSVYDWTSSGSGGRSLHG